MFYHSVGLIQSELLFIHPVSDELIFFPAVVLRKILG
jgi:hypothetical protein